MVSFSPFVWTCQIYLGLYGWILGTSFQCRITPDLRPYIWSAGDPVLFVKSILCRKLPLRTASWIPDYSGHPCLRLTIPLHQGSFRTWFLEKKKNLTLKVRKACMAHIKKGLTLPDQSL